MITAMTAIVVAIAIVSPNTTASLRTKSQRDYKEVHKATPHNKCPRAYAEKISSRDGQHCCKRPTNKLFLTHLLHTVTPLVVRRDLLAL